MGMTSEISLRMVSYCIIVGNNLDSTPFFGDIMRKLGSTFLAVLFIVSGVSLARAQDSVTPESNALIKELIEVTGGRQQFNDIMSMMMKLQREQSKEMMDGLFKDETGLASADKAMLSKMVDESMERITVRSQEFFTKKFDFDKMVDNVFVPVYTKHFTNDELRDLIAFYRTPTGQKSTREMPQMMFEATSSLTKQLMPEFMDFIKQVVDEETVTIKQKLSKKKTTHKS